MDLRRKASMGKATGRRLLACIVIAAALAAAGCGGDDDAGAPKAQRTAPDPKPATASQPRTHTIRIVERNLRAQGGVRTTTVRVGDRVHIIVRTDARDLVHMLFFDLKRRARTTHPARFSFVAYQAGTYQIESHGARAVERDTALGWLKVVE
jgi:hypothetical protein